MDELTQNVERLSLGYYMTQGYSQSSSAILTSYRLGRENQPHMTVIRVRFIT